MQPFTFHPVALKQGKSWKSDWLISSTSKRNEWINCIFFLPCPCWWWRRCHRRRPGARCTRPPCTGSGREKDRNFSCMSFYKEFHFDWSCDYSPGNFVFLTVCFSSNVCRLISPIVIRDEFPLSIVVPDQETEGAVVVGLALVVGHATSESTLLNSHA